MVKSSYSGKDIPPGKGIMYVRKDGRVLYFMNRKEEKNLFKLGRKPRTVAWTEEYRREKGQRIALAQHAAEHAALAETPAAQAQTAKPKAKAATKKASPSKVPHGQKAAKKATKKAPSAKESGAKE